MYSSTLLTLELDTGKWKSSWPIHFCPGQGTNNTH